MNVALVFAGGSGQRMRNSAKPKQFLEIYNKPIIVHTMEKFEKHKDIDGIVIVCVENWISYMNDLVYKYRIEKVKKIVPGGETGQLSIYHGLCAAKEISGDEKSIVLIHDGVRPLINEELISENIKVAKEKGNAITVVEATETVMMVNEKNELTQSVERKKCRFARAPQTYIYGQLLAAHDHAREENINSYIDSATLMQAEGYKLFPVMGKPENIKITTPSDFYTFRAIVEAEENSQILGF